MHVIGTAGHVDHGKTALIRALTGIETDKLPEERARGLTIDLGFAHLRIGDQVVGVVDVPGHERFIRNMVAGASGVECAMILIAADEGWMDQSDDHARVLALLGVRSIIVVVSKCDLVPRDRAEGIRADAVERIRKIFGIEPLSQIVSVVDGTGLDLLTETIGDALEAIERVGPINSEYRGAYVHVDRSFTIQGSGTVVTGTLRGGPLAREDRLISLPRGGEARIRGIQSYFANVESSEPVSRVALNLKGADPEALPRGSTLSTIESGFESVDEMIVQLVSTEKEFESTERLFRPGRNRTRIEVALGTAHRIATAYRAGHDSVARVVLDKSIPTRWGERGLLIRHGGSEIAAGFRVYWTGVTSRTELARISSHLSSNRDATDNKSIFKLRIFGYVRIGAQTETDPTSIRDASRVGPWLVLKERRRNWESAIRSRADQSETITTESLAGDYELPLQLVAAICDQLVQAGVLHGDGAGYRSASRSISLTPAGKSLLDELTKAGRSGIEPLKVKRAGTKAEMRNLNRLGLAKSLDGSIYYATDVYETVRDEILRNLAPGAEITIAHVRERTGLSRKYILPVLNRMESDGMLRREGDIRILLEG